MEVSVLVTTYNHEKYIAQALDSVLMQETDFDYEIVILEDCSTDATREIVLAYRKKHPAKIRLRLPDRNECSNQPFAEEFQAAPSRYIATLDGDDFWTSPKKLQKQVKFLEGHSDCAICFHNAIMVYEDGNRIPLRYSSAAQKPISVLEDLWQSSLIPVCTPIFRKDAIGEFPDWYNKVPFAYNDWALHIFCAQYGKIGYIDEVLAAYRIHKEGLWSKLDNMQTLEGRIDFYERMNANLGFRHNETVQFMISKYKNRLARARRMNEMAAAVLLPEATVIVMSNPYENLPRLDARRIWAFPERMRRERRRPFTSGAAGSVDAPWIGPNGVYKFHLYGGSRQRQLLGSVVVTQNNGVPSPGHSNKEPARNDAFIAAAPNPVPQTAGLGKTVISWNTGDGSPGAIYVSVEDQSVLYPADNAAAIAEMEALRSKGAEFLVVPRDGVQLLERYPELKKHLDRHYRLLASEEDVCLIYDLREWRQQHASDMAKS